MIELKEYCGGYREIQISRELTKKFEEHVGYNINEVQDFFDREEVLGEITVVIKGIIRNPKNSEIDDYQAKKELHNLIDAGLSLSAASKYLAKKNNVSKSVIYNMY